MSEMQETPVVYDLLGRRISVGDFIVWPGRQSSSLWMNKGEVLSIEMRPRYSWDDTMVPRIHVMREEEHWKTKEVEKRKTHIDVIERVVVVSGGR